MNTQTEINLNEIIWKTVNHPEIKNLEVSEYGHFRRKGKERVFFGTVDNNGYKSVKLGMGGQGNKNKKFLVHRLVAMTFHADKYKVGLVVDHKNEQKLDNHYKNLQFISQGENHRKSRLFRNQTGGISNRKLTEKEVRKCRKLYKNGTSIWTIWETVLNKKLNYASVLFMLHNRTYKEIV